MNTTDLILEAVRGIVAEALALDLEDVKPSDRFEHDLGGESIELLEVLWQSEKQFGIKLSVQNLFPEEKLIADQNGILTAESFITLKQELPFLDYDRIEDCPRKERLKELLTVEAIAHFVRRAIAHQQESNPLIASDRPAAPGLLNT